jgi:tRNA pseudouridine38-40 synthase
MTGLARSPEMADARPPADTSVLRLRLDLAYDGSGFAGWAKQPGLRTVQGELEAALATVLGASATPHVTGAGRTDAGVHARGQVAHVDVDAAALSHHQPGAFARRLNGLLEPDVRIKAVSVAPEGFEARFAALSRRYSYRVADGWLDPLRRHDTLAHPRSLDLDAMNAAANLLLGMHDFAAFCRHRVGATTQRTLLELVWVRDDAGVAVARVVADAFCHSMVRALVGALLEVGDGRRDVGWPAVVLVGRKREDAAKVAPARGLTLEEVRYPNDAELGARTEQTRRRRDDRAAELGSTGN